MQETNTCVKTNHSKTKPKKLVKTELFDLSLKDIFQKKLYCSLIRPEKASALNKSFCESELPNKKSKNLKKEKEKSKETNIKVNAPYNAGNTEKKEPDILERQFFLEQSRLNKVSYNILRALQGESFIHCSSEVINQIKEKVNLNKNNNNLNTMTMSNMSAINNTVTLNSNESEFSEFKKKKNTAILNSQQDQETPMSSISCLTGKPQMCVEDIESFISFYDNAELSIENRTALLNHLLYKSVPLVFDESTLKNYLLKSFANLFSTFEDKSVISELETSGSNADKTWELIVVSLSVLEKFTLNYNDLREFKIGKKIEKIFKNIEHHNIIKIKCKKLITIWKKAVENETKRSLAKQENLLNNQRDQNSNKDDVDKGRKERMNSGEENHYNASLIQKHGRSTENSNTHNNKELRLKETSSDGNSFSTTHIDDSNSNSINTVKKFLDLRHSEISNFIPKEKENQSPPTTTFSSKKRDKDRNTEYQTHSNRYSDESRNNNSTNTNTNNSNNLANTNIGNAFQQQIGGQELNIKKNNNNNNIPSNPGINNNNNNLSPLNFSLPQNIRQNINNINPQLIHILHTQGKLPGLNPPNNLPFNKIITGTPNSTPNFLNQQFLLVNNQYQSTSNPTKTQITGSTANNNSNNKQQKPLKSILKKSNISVTPMKSPTKYKRPIRFDDNNLEKAKIFKQTDEPDCPEVSEEEYNKIQNEIRSNPNYRLVVADMRLREISMEKENMNKARDKDRIAKESLQKMIPQAYFKQLQEVHRGNDYDKAEPIDSKEKSMIKAICSNSLAVNYYKESDIPVCPSMMEERMFDFYEEEILKLENENVTTEKPKEKEDLAIEKEREKQEILKKIQEFIIEHKIPPEISTRLQNKILNLDSFSVEDLPELYSAINNELYNNFQSHQFNFPTNSSSSISNTPNIITIPNSFNNYANIGGNNPNNFLNKNINVNYGNNPSPYLNIPPHYISPNNNFNSINNSISKGKFPVVVPGNIGISDQAQQQHQIPSNLNYDINQNQGGNPGFPPGNQASSNQSKSVVGNPPNIQNNSANKQGGGSNNSINAQGVDENPMNAFPQQIIPGRHPSEINIPIGNPYNTQRVGFNNSVNPILNQQQHQIGDYSQVNLQQSNPNFGLQQSSQNGQIVNIGNLQQHQRQQQQQNTFANNRVNFKSGQNDYNNNNNTNNYSSQNQNSNNFDNTQGVNQMNQGGFKSKMDISRYKTKPCKMYHSIEGCTREEKCFFIHDPRYKGKDIPNFDPENYKEEAMNKPTRHSERGFNYNRNHNTHNQNGSNFMRYGGGGTNFYSKGNNHYFQENQVEISNNHGNINRNNMMMGGLNNFQGNNNESSATQSYFEQGNYENSGNYNAQN